MPTATCIGSACCYEGSTYDTTQNICVPNEIYAQEYPTATTTGTTTTGTTTTGTTTTGTTTTGTTTTGTTTTTDVSTESFISGQVLGKYGGTPVKATSLNDDNIMPSYASLLNF
jgi:hypothetical protein